MQRVAFYASLAFAGAIFWYCLAPGIDPQSRWFNPLDGKLIASLLNPSTVFSAPAGSGLGFSSLLLYTFLTFPMVWSLLLLQEQEADNCATTSNDKVPLSLTNNIITAISTFVCASSFLDGGGILIPYMIFRRPMPFRQSLDSGLFPSALRFFEEQSKVQKFASNVIPFIEFNGRLCLPALLSLLLISFLFPFANEQCYWIVEWNAFLNRARSSQFTALALYDFTTISIALLDPMMDDAIRRGYDIGWKNVDGKRVSGPESGEKNSRDANRDRWRSEKRLDALRVLVPYVAILLIGPVAWICLRPRYDMVTGEGNWAGI